MKKCTIILLTSVLAFAGCNKENTVPNVSHKYPVFSCEMEEVTKTGLGASNTVLWTADDRVAVFNKTTGLQEYKANAGGSSATTELIAVGDPATGTGISAKVAFYPYSSTASCSESEGTFTVSTSVPDVQEYKTGSFGEGAAPMMAVISPDAEDQNKFSFRNVFGCLKLQFTGEGSVKSITVQGNNNEILAGDIAVSMTADGTPTYEFTGNTSTSVTLNCGEGVALSETVTPFYISLPCWEYSKGIKLTVTMTDRNSRVIATGGKLVIGRSAIQPMDACKLVDVNTVDMSKTNFKIKFCNSCYAYNSSNVTAGDGGTVKAQGDASSDYSKKYSLYGDTRYYEHPDKFFNALGQYSPKMLIDGKNDTGWTSFHGGNGTLCQNTTTKAETKFDDYDYALSALSDQFHAFGGRRVRVSIVIDMNEICNVASLGLVNFNRIASDGKTVVAHLKGVEFYVSNDEEFIFTPAYGKDRPAADYNYDNYANPNVNNWTLIAKSADLGFSTSQDDVKWVDVPYALLTSGKAKGRFLKIVFPESASIYDGLTGFSAKELYVKKATNL